MQIAHADVSVPRTQLGGQAFKMASLRQPKSEPEMPELSLRRFSNKRDLTQKWSGTRSTYHEIIGLLLSSSARNKP